MPSVNPMLWAGAPTGPIQNPTLAQRAAAQGILFGGTTNVNYMADADYVKFAASEYGGGIITSEIAGWNHVEPAQGTFDFSSLDTELTIFPANNRPQVRLYLGGNYPAWVSTAVNSPATALSILQNHISNLAAHWPYPIVTHINLFNECIKPFGGDSLGFQPDPFKTQLGNSFSTGYIATAYQLCRTAWGPNVKLGLNFNHLEPEEADDTAQRALVLAAYQGFFNAGFPMQWFGNECHGNAGVTISNPQAVSAFYQAIANLGAALQITELDNNDVGVADITNADRDAGLSAVLSPIVSLMLSNPACNCVQTWADNDRYNWEDFPTPPNQTIGRNDGVVGRTAIKDWAYRPKPFYSTLGTAFDNAGRAGSAIRKDCTVVVGAAVTQTIAAPSVVSVTSLGTPTIAIANNQQQNFPNEPPGMTAVINTGAINGITLPSSDGQFVTIGTNSWQIYGVANVALTSASDPTSTGLRISFPSSLAGGSSPCSIVNVAISNSIPQTGKMYYRIMVRYDPRYTLNGNVAQKITYFVTRYTNACNAQTQNHVLDSINGGDGNNTDLFACVIEQCSQFAVLGGPSNAANQLGGAGLGIWHLVEILCTPESVVGVSGDGTFKLWVDSTLTTNLTNINWWGTQNTQPAWFQWNLAPYYGGGTHSPPAMSPPMFADYNLLYASVG